MRALAILVLAGFALAGCEAQYGLPGGGTLSLSPTQPIGNPVQSSNANACIARDIQGRPRVVARYRCYGDDDGVIRGR